MVMKKGYVQCLVRIAWERAEAGREAKTGMYRTGTVVCGGGTSRHAACHSPALDGCAWRPRS